MKAAILSDIHANRQALEAVLVACDAEKVDTFWLLGDYVDYGASALSVLDTLQLLNAEHVLCGNHDACLFHPDVRPSQTPHGYESYLHTMELMRQQPKKFEWLRNLTPIKTAWDDRVLLVHGTYDNPFWGKFSMTNASTDMMQKMASHMENRNFEYMFMGHSHVSFSITINGRTIVNPGSVGQPRNGIPLAQYAIFENGDITFKRVSYDIDAAAADIKKAGLPKSLWQRLHLGK